MKTAYGDEGTSVDRDVIRDLSKKYDSFYVYDEETISRNIAELSSCFPDVKLLYSFKANPNEHVIDTVRKNGMGCDAASSGEVWKATIAGFQAKDIYYSAPGKSVEDIDSTIGMCNIIADSLEEIRMIDSVAEKKGMHIGIGIRINPDFTYDFFTHKGVTL